MIISTKQLEAFILLYRHDSFCSIFYRRYDCRTEYTVQRREPPGRPHCYSPHKYIEPCFVLLVELSHALRVFFVSLAQRLVTSSLDTISMRSLLVYVFIGKILVHKFLQFINRSQIYIRYSSSFVI